MDGPISSDFMNDVFIFGSLLKMALLLVALVISTQVLRYFDRLAGVSFKEWVNDAKTKGKYSDLALYYGLRFLGVAYLVSNALS